MILWNLITLFLACFTLYDVWVNGRYRGGLITIAWGVFSAVLHSITNPAFLN